MTRATALDEASRQAIVTEVTATVRLAATRMPLPPVHIMVDTDLGGVIPEVGVGGFAPNANEVILSIDPRRADLAAIIEDALPPQLAHELHHAARHAAIGYGSTLFQAVVSEGLADHFSLELYGIEPPPWSVALTGDDLATWTDAVLAEPEGAYDHARWFFGSDGVVPRWTGYAVGFAVVGAYLEEHAASSPSQLVGEPASSFRND